VKASFDRIVVIFNPQSTGQAEEGFRAMLDGNTVGKIVFTR
jgi:hypothetical protein